jgi:hypothetical protein
MTERQLRLLALILEKLLPTEFHHGDCVGADAQAHLIANPYTTVIIHPPLADRLRAGCDPSYGSILTPKPYLERNHDIVDACDLLIAAPVGPEIQRSGTWATVRYARSIGRPTITIE